MDQAQHGAKALSSSDYPAAIEHYTRALIVNPHATDYYIKRSTAYSRLKANQGGPNGAAALRDAEMAVALGVQRARREQIIAGQMRRGIALFQLGRFGDAEFVFKHVRAKVGPPPSARDVQGTMESAMRTAAGEGGGAGQKSSINNELHMWESQVKGKLSNLDPHDEKAVVNVEEYPKLKVPEQEELKKLYQAQLTKSDDLNPIAQQSGQKSSLDDNKNKQAVTDMVSAPEAKQQPQPSVTPKALSANSIRHEWYQSSETVVITLYAKGVPKEHANIDIQEHSVGVSLSAISNSVY